MRWEGQAWPGGGGGWLGCPQAARLPPRPPALAGYEAPVLRARPADPPLSRQLDILCNEEILGKDHTLKFVVVTRWRFKVRPWCWCVWSLEPVRPPARLCAHAFTPPGEVFVRVLREGKRVSCLPHAPDGTDPQPFRVWTPLWPGSHRRAALFCESLDIKGLSQEL